MQWNRKRASSFIYPLFVFAVNLFITWRFLRSEYIDQLPSIEGAFISLARYIRVHWPGYDWLPLWNGGYPFARAYQPALHYTVAAFAAVTGLSAASAYHFVTAVTYSLAGVAFFYLAKALGTGRRVAFGGALFFSVFSPSVVFLKNVRDDAGGFTHARRLQAMVQYGEGPNITGLMLGMFALALLYAALRNRRPGTALAAALTIAAVPATNWPSTVALCLGIGALMLAFDGSEMRGHMGRAAVIGALAICFAGPFALPSTVWSTFHNANIMSDAPTAGYARWIVLAALAAAIFIGRKAMLRQGVGFAVRFAVVYSIALCGIVFSAAWLHINLLPQPMRFHVAMEIPLALTVVLLAQSLLMRWPRLSVPLAVVTLVFCSLQTYHFRQHSRSLARRLDVGRTLEYEEAKWFDANMHGQRVSVPGTVSFWLNAFNDTPQYAGCCEQSLIHQQNFIARYIMGAGYQSDAESADYSTLWMKAWAVQAVGIGGTKSREAYKAFDFPQRFRDRLPLLWSSGDDYIYRVPERAAGLARVVRSTDSVRQVPANGIDVRELRPFVTALDDGSLPTASFAWQGSNAAHISGVMQPDQVVSVAVTYEAGWAATVAGHAAPMHSDGLGLIVIEPHCNGACEIDMTWSPGAEPYLMWALAFLAMVVSAGWWRYLIQRRLKIE